LSLLGIVVIGYAVYKKQARREYFVNADTDLAQYFSTILKAIQNVPVPSALGAISQSMMTSGSRISTAYFSISRLPENTPNKSLFVPILLKAIADAVEKRINEIVAKPTILSPSNL
jgi:hypothetical protein